MRNRKRLITVQMLSFEFRNVIGNPYIHIFGVGMPVFMMILICRSVAAEMAEGTLYASMATSVFLGIGAMIPMATVLMGYGISHAQELEKGIPQRMELFGIMPGVSMCNRILAEGIFMLLAFGIYFAAGYIVVGVESPRTSGLLIYILCMVVFSVMMFCLAHGIASLIRRFGLTYCVTMILYFVFMILGGMMGISYDKMPGVMQLFARMLPVTYINRDFYTVWKGESYNFMPMIQSFLLLGAITGILLFVTAKRGERKLH